MNAIDDDAALNEAAYFDRLADLAARRAAPAPVAATRRRRCTAAAAS